MRIQTLAKGALSFAIPNLRTVHGYDNPLGTISAESCYSIFMRHLVLLRQAGIPEMPQVVAEIGPGSSIGVGLAALLAGAERYYALDVIDFTDPKSDVAILDSIADLFRSRAVIPSRGVHSRRFPDLDDYGWPGIFTPDAKWETRTSEIRDDIATRSGRFVQIAAPWTERAVIVGASVDWILSQSVLEHVDDLEGAYEGMAQWLKPGGCMSHLIDFSSHRMTAEWNGHWAISDLTWRIMRGRRPYLLNREPYAVHQRIAGKHNFVSITEKRAKRYDGLIPSDFSPRFCAVSDDDARTNMAFAVSKLAHRMRR